VDRMLLCEGPPRGTHCQSAFTLNVAPLTTQGTDSTKKVSPYCRGLQAQHHMDMHMCTTPVCQ
jgi:hypothetical protein